MVKKVLMVIAPADFRDEEYFDTKEELEKAGIETTTVNSTGQPSKSAFGKIVKPDNNFYDIDTKEYDAIVFVGGAGNVSIDHTEGGTAVVYTGVVAGTILPVKGVRVNSTSTTATNMVWMKW